MTAAVIAVENVSKSYGDVLALDDVTLQVQPGEIYALLGLNGAGKTTLIRALLGMVRPTSGHVAVFGRPLTDRSVWSRVGYLVESASAYPELTVRENLDIARRLHRVTDKAAVDEAIDLFGLAAYADRTAKHLSLGNVQRLGLAKALLHRPELVLLDEPINGLDPAGIVEIRHLLVDLAAAGTTMFVSSHLLAEVARIATRIAVLHQGQLIDEFDADELATRVRPHLEVASADLHDAARALQQAGLDPHTNTCVLTLEDPASVAHPERISTVLVQAGAPPTRLVVVEEDLETYFLRLTEAPPRRDGQAPVHA